MENIITATAMMAIVLAFTWVIVSWVSYAVEKGWDNFITVLGPIVFLLWILLIFALKD